MMRLTDVQKGFVIGAAVLILDIIVSSVTDVLVLNFFFGYALGAAGVFAWFKWTDAE